jgi:ATP-dependent helicase/nuclease subunit A
MKDKDTAPNTQPYNPWASYIVEASAGSGKTWQLSRRFLALVIAGADPATILTVTFTKKAAADMRERIIKDALLLGAGVDGFAEFWQQIKNWCPTASKKSLRTAEEASEIILGKTQTLKIMTIDALFFQWCRRHPIETSINVNDDILESPWTLMSSLETKKLYQKAWSLVLSSAKTEEQNKLTMQSLIANAPNGKLRSLLSAITPLIESETFAWYIKLNSAGRGLKPFTLKQPVQEPHEFIADNEDLFKLVINLAGNPEKKELGLRAVQERDFQALVTNTIINSGRDALNGNTFSKAKKSGDVNYATLGEKLADWAEQQKLANLNRTGELLWALFEARANAAHKLKSEQRVGGFVDTVKGVSILACDEDLDGARSMAWSGIRHLMLDEFQDTSRLQWLIFEKLAREILSGGADDSQFGPPPGVFIVGDKKQSIYRFREADPEVLGIAKISLKPFGLNSYQMSQSYRSSKLILDYVNQVFVDGSYIKDFPIHAAATNKTYGSLTLYKLSSDADKPADEAEAQSTQGESILSFPEREAQTIAQHIKSCLDGTISIKIPFGKDGRWRRPQPRDFVVLYAKSTDSHVYEDALRKLEIPCVRSERKGYYQRPEIKDLTALIRWLAWPADSAALCTILKSPICDLSDQMLQELLANGDDGIWENLRKQAKPTWDLLSDLSNTRYDDSVAVLTGKLLTKYGIADRYLAAFGAIDGPLAKANILKWFDEMRSVSSSETGTVDGLIQWLDEKSEEDETGNAALIRDSVTLMTIHKSKGLEFPCVVLAGTADDWHRDDHGWIKDARPGMEGFWYIGTAAQRPKSSKEIDSLIAYNASESRSEKARLLYVALTRASHHLVVTGTNTDKLNAFWPVLETAANKLTDYQKDVINSIDGTEGHILTPKDTEAMGVTDQPLSITPSNVPIVSSGTGYQALKILTPSQRSKKSKNEQLDDSLPDGESDVESGGDSRRINPEDSKTYGILVHKLIELALLDQTWNTERLKGYLRHATKRSLTDDLANDLLAIARKEVSDLLASSTWKDLLADATEIYCELPMAALDGDNLVNAVADLVVRRGDGSFTVIDFKTTQTSPEKARELCKANGYLDQVMDYRDILKKCHPDKNITGHIVFVNPVCIVDLN